VYSPAPSGAGGAGRRGAGAAAGDRFPGFAAMLPPVSSKTTQRPLALRLPAIVPCCRGHGAGRGCGCNMNSVERWCKQSSLAVRICWDMLSSSLSCAADVLAVRVYATWMRHRRRGARARARPGACRRRRKDGRNTSKVGPTLRRGRGRGGRAGQARRAAQRVRG